MQSVDYGNILVILNLFLPFSIQQNVHRWDCIFFRWNKLPKTITELNVKTYNELQTLPDATGDVLNAINDNIS